MEEWIDRELDGYPTIDALPEYRKLRGLIRCWNPYHGWVPLHMAQNLAEAAERIWLTDGIAKLESGIEDNKGMIQYALPAGKAQALMKGMDVPMEPAIFISSGAIVGIVDAVRNHILKWALELEKKGVKGDSMSFTPKEVQAASQVNYITNIGTMSHSQLQQHSGGSQAITVTNDLTALREVMTEIVWRVGELPANVAAEAKADAETVLAQAGSKNPKEGIIREAVKSVRTILENAAGSALSSELLPKLIQAAQFCGLG